MTTSGVLRPGWPRRHPTRRWGLAAVLTVLGLAGCWGGGRSGPAEDPLPPAVEALPARAGGLPLEETLHGVVRARDQVAIRPEIGGTVVEVRVRDGATVTAGQQLVRLDDEVLVGRLRAAEADLRRAEATAVEAGARVEEVRARVVRNRALAEQGMISELELETLEAQLAATRAAADQAAAQVEEARATAQERRSALAKATVRSPIDGVVGQRDVEVGMVVGASSTLFVVGDLEDLVIDVPLTQELLRRVEVGAPVELELGGPGAMVLEAELSRISPFLEAESFSTTAEVDVPGDGAGLRPGMFVTVRVLLGASEQATLVPASALWEDPRSGDWEVFVVADAAGLAEAETAAGEVPDEARSVEVRRVEVLAEGRGRVGVRGVAEGEWVVTNGQHLLQESVDAGASGLARVRPTSWARVLELEGLQREDLLEGFLAKQRAVARALGAELPASTEAVDAALAAASPAAGSR